MYDHEALLPCQVTINPANPDPDHPYFWGHGDMLIMQDIVNPRKLRAWAGATAKGSTALGTVHSAHHDQAGYYMGTYRVIGSRTADGEIIGEMPDRKIPYWTYK